MTADDEAARRRAEAFVKRSYRTARIPPLVGIKEVMAVLDIDKATLYRWMKPGSGLLGPERTHMIPPAPVGAGPAYAAALRRRAEAMRADDAAAEKVDALLKAADEAEQVSGRSVWVLEDVERFGHEIGRIRAPVGKAKARR